MTMSACIYQQCANLPSSKIKVSQYYGSTCIWFSYYSNKRMRKMYAKALDHQVISQNADYMFHFKSLQKCNVLLQYCWTIYAA